MELVFMIGIYDTWNLKYNTNEFTYETETDIEDRLLDAVVADG